VAVGRPRRLSSIAFVRAALGCLFLVTAFGSPSQADSPPSTMYCSVLGRSISGFFFREGVWSGEDPFQQKSARLPRFKVQEPPKGWAVSAWMFSRLDTQQPIVRPVYGERAGAEAIATVLGRDSEVIFLTWPWALERQWQLAVVNFKVRRATIGTVESGVTAVGVESAIAECK
jgi:hypothetical protein